MPTSPVRRLSEGLRRHGLKSSLIILLQIVVGFRPFRLARLAWWRWRDRAYDRRHGTDTAGEVRFESLRIDSRNKAHGTWYRATPRHAFARMMAAVTRDEDLSAYSFVDFGCGKGRVLLFAAELPFRQVIGVEFAPELAEAARSNAEIRFGRDQRRIQVHTQDVVDFTLPAGPCVLFFYTPFDIEVSEAVARMVEREVKADPRPVWVLWYNVVNSTTAFYRLDWLEVRDGQKTPWTEGVPQSFTAALALSVPWVVFRNRAMTS